MERRIIFGNWEAVCILVIAICTQIFLNLPRAMAESAGTAGWILTIYVSIIVLIIFFLISKLFKNFEGKDILDISEYLGGNIVRIISGLILLIYLIFIVSLILREFGEDLKIIALNLSPISFILVFFTMGMVISSFTGLEALVRIGAIITPIVTVGYIIILIAVFQYFDISRIMPILGFGPQEIFIKGISKVSIFSGLTILFLIVPFIKTYKKFRKVGYTSLVISSVFITLSVLSYLLVYQYPTATESFLPIFQLARLINYGRFFQRVESLFSLIWIISAFQYLSIGMFFIIYVFKKTFKLEYQKPLIIPFAIILFTLSLIPQNLVAAIELETKYFRNIAWVVNFLYIILILIAANIKRKMISEGSKKSEKS